MPDRKHIEYCIKLGNKFVQQKLEEEYIAPQMNYDKNQPQFDDTFKSKIQNWNS